MSKPKPSKPVLLAVSLKQFYYLKGIAEFTFKQLLMLKGTVRFTLSHSVILKRIALVVSLSLVFGLSYLVTWSPSLAHAATTSTVNFQARLENASGAIVPDGTYNVEFKIYNTLSTGGTAQGVCTGNCLWYEDYLVGGTPVTVSNGYMTVNLGSQTAFPSTIPWGSPLYLAMNIGGTGGSPTWDGEMSPRLTLTAVPTAFSLESAAGSFTSTLTFVQPTANESILLPAESGSTETVCYQGDATNCGYIANSSTQQASSNFNISNEGQLATLDATGAGSANTLAIGAGATYTGAINIDTSASVTTGTVSIGGTAQTGAITVGAATTSTQTINIENATATGGTQTVSIDSGNDTASTQTVNIATGTSTTSGAKNVNIATGAPGTGTSTTVDIGNGGGANGTVSVLIGSNGAAAHTTTIQGGNGAGAISLQAASGGVISIGTNATNAVNIGLSGTPTYVGQSHNNGTGTNTVSVTSVNAGDILLLATKGNINNRITSVTGGGVTAWHMVTYFNGYLHEEIWEGTVITPGTTTVTANYLGAGCSGPCEMTVEEFSSTYGASTNWNVTTAGQQQNISSGNIIYPSLTASETGGLFFGYGYTIGSATGTGSGSFSYIQLPSTSNSAVYYTNITKGTAYAPVANSSAATSDALDVIVTDSTSSINIDGTTALEGAITSPLVVAGTTNSTLAFQVQNSSGSTAFGVDTVNNIVTSDDTLQVGPGATTTTPKFLYLADVPNNAAGNPQIIGQWTSSNNWGIGPNSNASSPGDNALRIGTTTANGVNTWSTTQNVSLLVAGTEKVQPTTGNDSTTAFQVMSAGGSALLTTDTTNLRVGINATYASMTVPTGVTIGTISGGSLTATTAYYYRITAIDSAGGETAASTPASCVATTGVNKTVTLYWTAVTGASGYRIYRTSSGASCGADPGGELLIATVLSNYTSGSPYDDSNATVGTSAFPTSNTAYVSTNVSNNELQLSVGGNGTPTSQDYVSGTVPTSALSSTSLSGTAEGEFVQGKYAYTVDTTGGTGYLQIMDISNPTVPVFETSNNGFSLGSSTQPWGIEVVGSYAYITDYSSGSSTTGAMQIVDVSNPTSPSIVGSVSTNINNGTNTCDGPRSVSVEGHYAYVVSDGNGTTANSCLEVFDVSNPAHPASAMAANTFFSTNISQPKRVYAQGRYLYIANSSSATVETVDISNPASPSSVGVSAALTAPHSMTVAGRYAYVADFSANALEIIDESIPSSPALVGSVSTGASSNPQGVYVQGRYAYVADGVGNMKVIDVSNPASPQVVGTITTANDPIDVMVVGRYAYVLGESSDVLQIFDMGGTYEQQVQAGGIETGTLEVDNNESVQNLLDVRGGLEVSGGAQLQGNLNVAGNASFTSLTNSTTAFVVQNSSSVAQLSVDTSNGRVIIGTGSGGDTTGYILILDNKSSSSDPSGVNGAIYYNYGGTGGPAGTGNGEGVFRCYQGGSWRDCLGLQDFSQRRFGFRTAAGGGMAATTMTNTNIQAPSVTGTAASNIQTESYYVSFTNTAGAGITGDTSLNTDTKAEYLPKYETRVRLDPTAITSTPYWMGLGNLNMASLTPPTTATAEVASIAAVAYESTVNGGDFLCVTDDGANMSGTNMGVAAAVGSYYDIIVDLSVSGSVTCSISTNGGAFVSVTKTTNQPVAATNLGMQDSLFSSGASRAISVAYQYLEYN